jgi:S-phase kinase-associated protein 1
LLIINAQFIIITTLTCLHILITKHEQVSKEGDTFEVSIEIAKLSNLVVTTLGEEEDEDDDDDDNHHNLVVEIPLPNVKTVVLAKVIEYCTHYTQIEPSE